MGRVPKNILVTQKLMSVSAQYEVVVEGEATPQHSVKGDFMTTTPSLQLFDKDNKLVASLKGNVLKTKFQIRSDKNDELASVNFSAVLFVVTLFFVYRSFYGMRIESGSAPTPKAEPKKEEPKKEEEAPEPAE